MFTHRKRILIALGILTGLISGGLLFGPAWSEPEAAPINPDACVYIMNFGLCDTSIQLQAPLRNGFVVGDGQYVLTAAHCVTDFEHTCQVFRQPLVISPYYGDVFEAEIIALDEENDIAVLKPAWDYHPGLGLESGAPPFKIEQITAAGYPPKNKKLGGHDDQPSLAIRRETVSLVESGGRGKKALCIGPVKYVGKGWSGSPLINPETGRVVGITCSKEHKQASLRIGSIGKFEIPFTRKSYIYGCDTAAIRALFEKHNLPCATAADRLVPTDGRNGFERIVRAEDILETGDVDPARTAFEQVCSEQPECTFAHLMTGFMHPLETGVPYFQAALSLSPDSAFVRTAFGHYLFGNEKYRQAAEEFQAVTDCRRDHLFAWHGRLRALVLSDPNTAVTEGRELTQRWPDNPNFWFELCKAYRRQQNHLEELNAVETAIALCDQRPYVYQRYLADALGSNKRYAEAEAAYRELLAEHECAKCWSAYTALLAMMGPEKQARARAAFEKTQSANTDHSLPASWFEKYEQAIKNMSRQEETNDPNQPVLSVGL